MLGLVFRRGRKHFSMQFSIVGPLVRVPSAHTANDRNLTYGIRTAIFYTMPKPSHRETILTEGLRVVHERGFAGASVRDIIEAAGVPQGSFTNHFASKEAFCLEVLDR